MACLCRWPGSRCCGQAHRGRVGTTTHAAKAVRNPDRAAHASMRTMCHSSDRVRCNASAHSWACSMLTALTPFSVEPAGRFTSAHVVFASSNPVFTQLRRPFAASSIPAAPPPGLHRRRPFVAIGRLHARERSKRLEMGSGCGYPFGCRSVPVQLSVWATRASRLCGHVSSWIH